MRCARYLGEGHFSLEHKDSNFDCALLEIGSKAIRNIYV